MRQLLRQPPRLDPAALRGRKISKFFCICSRRWASFRLFARADGFRNLLLIFPFTFLLCMCDPLEDCVYHRSQHSNDTVMTPRMDTILLITATSTASESTSPVAWVDTEHPQANRTHNNCPGSASAPSRTLCIHKNTGRHWSAWSRFPVAHRRAS